MEAGPASCVARRGAIRSSGPRGGAGVSIDTQGRKHVLGLREGATETAAVTTGLLSDLVTRGLPTDRTLLFVIDGAQGLRRAITDVFGSRGVVQRCQVHYAEFGTMPITSRTSLSRGALP